MSQTNVDFSQNPSGAQLMDDFLDKMQENVLTSNSGLQRPEYAQEGTVWLDKTTTPWVYKLFDGSDDIIIGQFDAENNKFIPSDPMTTAGDLIVKGTDGNPTRLAPGIAGTVLTSNGAGKLPSYQKSDYQLVSNLEQTLSESTDKYPSSKLVNDEFNKRKLIAYDRGYTPGGMSGNFTAVLQDWHERFSIPVVDNITITIDTSQLTFPKEWYTMVFEIYFPNGAKTVNLSYAGGIRWISGLTPDFTNSMSHFMALTKHQSWYDVVMSDAGTLGG